MSSALQMSHGERVDPFNIVTMPPADVFCRSLAMMNRYTGHTLRPYSVAEHTCHLASHPEVIEAGLQRTALLHDFNEALTNDLPHPLKARMPEYVAFEEMVQRQIFAYFNEPWENMERFTEFDRRICCDEMGQLFFPPVAPWIEPLGIYITTFDAPDWKYQYEHLSYLCSLKGIL